MTKAKCISGLYAITDHQSCDDDKLYQDVLAFLSQGGKYLQYRDKQNRKTNKLARARHLMALCQDHDAYLLINDDIHLCQQSNAHGVHLGQSDLAIDEARKILGPDAIIGSTCHDSLTLALKAQQQGATYIALGRFFPSTSKPDAPPASLACIKAIRQQCTLPLVAIGGITLDNAPTLLQEGIDALAVIHDLWSQDNIQQRVHAYQQLFSPHR